MTSEEIDKMPAGLDMDIAIAKALGWVWMTPTLGSFVGDKPHQRHIGGWCAPDGTLKCSTLWQWKPSTDIAPALWVALSEPPILGYDITHRVGYSRVVVHWRMQHDRDTQTDHVYTSDSTDKSLPLAICRAILKAATGAL